MSNLAYARPAASPAPSAPLRPVARDHIEIVTTRAQRSARPKVAYAIVTVMSLFAIFGAQLLLSIVVSDGAYQIAALQSQQKELVRTQQDLTERLDLRNSTQYLAANAAKLGMVPGSSPQFLDLASGAVSPAPGTIDPSGCGGTCNLVANSLLGAVPLIDPSAAASNAVATGGPSAPASGAVAPTVVTALPVPVTH